MSCVRANCECVVHNVKAVLSLYTGTPTVGMTCWSRTVSMATVKIRKLPVHLVSTMGHHLPSSISNAPSIRPKAKKTLPPHWVWSNAILRISRVWHAPMWVIRCLCSVAMPVTLPVWTASVLTVYHAWWKDNLYRIRSMVTLCRVQLAVIIHSSPRCITTSCSHASNTNGISASPRKSMCYRRAGCYVRNPAAVWGCWSILIARKWLAYLAVVWVHISTGLITSDEGQ